MYYIYDVKIINSNPIQERECSKSSSIPVFPL